ncbi:MAG TPA: SIMPL domain-containing protein [Thermomicrobiales bacterium]|nr:SIMPL domain-containing protein [Thermomicrobiales bacterium]
MTHTYRRTFVIILLAMLILFGGQAALHPAAGQEAGGTPAPEREPETVSVLGEGRIAVAPDTAAFVAGVEVVRSTLSEAQAVATEQMAAVIDTLVAAGVAEEDIQTVMYHVEVIQDQGPTPPEPVAAQPEPAAPQAEPAAPAPPATPEPVQIRGFRVVNQVRVQVHDVDRLGELLDAAVSAGANAIGGVEFSVANPAEAMSRARTEAVRDARRAAEDLAAAAGLSLGGVLAMTEEDGAPPRSAAVVQEAAGGVPIQAGRIEIVSTVRVTYALETAQEVSSRR